MPARTAPLRPNLEHPAAGRIGRSAGQLSAMHRNEGGKGGEGGGFSPPFITFTAFPSAHLKKSQICADEFCRSVGASPRMPAAQTRLASPGHRIASLWASFASGIPTPIPAQPTPLRTDLEHVARGAESRNFNFPVFGGEKVKLREHLGSYRNHHRGDNRENPFRFRHLGIGQFRFGTGSGSG